MKKLIYTLFSLPLIIFLLLFKLSISISATNVIQKSEKQKLSDRGVYAIVDGDCLIGGMVNGKWMDSKEIFPHIKGGEKYRFYTIDKYIGEGIGGIPIAEGEGNMVEIKPISNKRDDYTHDFVGLIANHNPLPRIPRIQNSEKKRYEKIVKKILVQNGMSKAPVNITQIVSVDLEGDGKEEVFIRAAKEATNNSQENYFLYSIIVMKKVINGKEKYILLAFNSNKHMNPEYDLVLNIMNLLDIDGDGVMEIIIEEQYYEGITLYVYKVKNVHKELVISDYCGS